MISDRERESRDYLFKLMRENPELPAENAAGGAGKGGGKKSVQPIRQRGGTGVNERYREVCENRDWSVTVFDDGTVELEKYSPAGEDFIVAVDAENFVENVKKYAADFDPDEHIEMWVMARHNGAKGVPSIRELVHDAEDIDKMLQELAAALQEAEDSAA